MDCLIRRSVHFILAFSATRDVYPSEISCAKVITDGAFYSYHDKGKL